MTATLIWRTDVRAMWYSKHGRRMWTALEIGFGVCPVATGRLAGAVWTTDGWQTTHVAQAVWESNLPNPYGGLDERWKVRLEVGPTSSLVRFSYALYAQDAEGHICWDNNHWHNYENIV